MGIDITLAAVRRDKQQETTCFYYDRLTRIGEVLMLYCRGRAPVFTDESGMPRFLVTPRVWDSLVELISGQADDILYLVSYVTATFNDEGFIPVELRDFSDIDLGRVAAFDRWQAQVFQYPRLMGDGVSVEPKEVESVITQACILLNWMRFDSEIRPFLLDEKYMVMLYIA